MRGACIKKLGAGQLSGTKFFYSNVLLHQCKHEGLGGYHTQEHRERVNR